LTHFPRGRYDPSAGVDRPEGSRAISTRAHPPQAGHDFDRLDRAVQQLAARFRAVVAENARLAREVAERERRMAELESKLREGNQLRRDVAKRIDDLIGQIDHLEVQLGQRGD
jgi:septal ring factor EnvC (AmiA/AmiB activator)